jgi:hypothetical protein
MLIDINTAYVWALGKYNSKSEASLAALIAGVQKVCE